MLDLKRDSEEPNQQIIILVYQGSRISKISQQSPRLIRLQIIVGFIQERPNCFDLLL